MPTDGEFASSVAEKLQKAHLAAIEQGDIDLDEGGPMSRAQKKGIFEKIEFRWRKDDEKIIEQIQAAVDQLFGRLFSDAIATMDDFYNAMKVPIDVSGGIVEFKKDSRGRDVEDWSQLTGQDIEKTILDITRIKLELAPRLNDLLLEAVFAKHVADDKAHDGYSELLEGTVKDREAHASRFARQDKYQAYFRYYLYSHAEVFMRELNNFSRVLERIRFWRIDEGGKTSS